MECKIEHLKIFDYEIIKCKIPKNLYKNNLFKKDVYAYFESSKKYSICERVYEGVGNVFTTAGMQNSKFSITSLKNITPLINYITDIIAHEYFKKNSDCNEYSILYTRIWMNKSFLKSSVKCHVHSQRNEKSGTAIFYFNVPRNGSKLIILKKNIGNKNVTEEHKDISHYIGVESGDLIIHPSEVPHATTEHLSSDPRICIVFDFILKENNKISNNISYK